MGNVINAELQFFARSMQVEEITPEAVFRALAECQSHPASQKYLDAIAEIEAQIERIISDD